MANVVVDPGREGFLIGEIDWDSAVIKAALVRGYTVNTAHKFVSDVTTAGGTLVAESTALASKTATNGVLDAADVTFSAVTAGAAITSIIIFQDSTVTGTGSPQANTARRLIAVIDTAAGLPVTPNGGAITVAWDNGTNRIARL